MDESGRHSVDIITFEVEEGEKITSPSNMDSMRASVVRRHERCQSLATLTQTMDTQLMNLKDG